MNPVSPSHTAQAVRDAKASGGHVVPESKGWFPADRTSIIRASLATAALACVRTYLLTEPPSKLLDPGNVAPFLLFQNADQLNFKVWHSTNFQPGAPFIIAVCATGLAYGLLRDGLDNWMKCAMYGLAAGALHLIVHEGTERTYLSQNVFVNYVV